MATVKKIKKAQAGIKEPSDSTSYYKQRANAALKNLASDDLSNFGSNVKDFAKKQREYKSYTRKNKPGYDAKGKSNFEKLLGLKNGGKTMIKRADGSTSQRGLWDNIRAAAKKNKAAGKPGKKPTSAILKQEKKIKSQTKKK